MKIWIPKCGDSIRLDNDWNFKLKFEHRNTQFSQVYKPDLWPKNWHYRDPQPNDIDVNICAGTILVFDRVYIRQDADDFASVTFVIKHHTDDNFIGERFWASLEDVNTINATFDTTDNYVGIGAQSHYKNALKDEKDPTRIIKRQVAATKKEFLEKAKAACATAAQSSKWASWIETVAASIRRIQIAEFNKQYGNISNAKCNIETAHVAAQIKSSYGSYKYEENSGWCCDSSKKIAENVIQRKFKVAYHTYIHVLMPVFIITSREDSQTGTWELISIEKYDA